MPRLRVVCWWTKSRLPQVRAVCCRLLLQQIKPHSYNGATWYAGEKVKELRIWTDAARLLVQGIHILTSSAQELDGRPAGLSLTSANVTKKGPDLGTAILLGVAAAEKVGSELLSAISFTFLVVPASSAISVDMANIDLKQLKFEPKVDVKTSVR